MTLHDQARAALTGWTAPTPDEESLRLRFLEHLDRHDDAMWRSCAPGHLTATTAVLSHDGAQVLLTLHPKAGMWLPMGGHCEAGDVSLEQAALREATEESGIAGLTLLPGPLALDRHRVWCHPPHSWHLDVEYGAVAPPGAEFVISDESLELRWVPVDDIPEPTDEATRRLARRARAALAAVPRPEVPVRSPVD
ncbi:NUDIX hydrolase [Sphaerisporangium melleum]|uniref:NUDIX hydrolase n=1 Tax=Sphaerisporangium melleum TaxID=321316 RepID=A0A917VQM2_9ACTN|nr:NUDIX domain-containing protein [Sphaerisporangium melleum]GGL09039.1 NUDIX hydrolase [Sphaerisporangium melleum]GII68753.1 NUDIX hydrolase [Sphaerisporangium melleum]